MRDRQGAGRFRQAFSAVRRKVGQASGRHGFAEPDVLLKWREVVGPELAGTCRPVKVSYSAKRGGSGLGATLVIATDSAHAPQVSHQSARIIERVNRFYGYAAVSRVKVTQEFTRKAGAGGFAEPAAGFVPEARPDPVAREKAESLAASVRNEELRAALTALGERIYSGAAARKGAEKDRNGD